MAEASTITDNGAFIRGCSNNVAAHKASFDERTASVLIQGLKVELSESVSGFKTLRLMARNDDKNLLFFYSFNMLLERKDSGRGHPVTRGLWSLVAPTCTSCCSSPSDIRAVCQSAKGFKI